MIEMSCAECGCVFMTYRSAASKGRKFCSRLCMTRSRSPQTKEDVRRFCTVSPDTGCWVWKGKPDSRGYGQVLRAKVACKSAHRLSWTLHFGRPPKGIMVCHKCDNPPCVNPDHLFLGTGRDNSVDAMLKDRVAHGERHGMAKLTEKSVLEIRGSSLSQVRLAQKYGVSKALIYYIQKGIAWRRTA